jgi:Tol biopolymer transport system component
MRSRTLVRTAVLLTSCAPYAGCGDDESPKTTTSAAPAQAAAQNGLLVYGAEKEGLPTQLFTIKPDGTGATQITHLTDGEAVNPDWSRDGSRLTYEVGSEKNAGVFVSSADGSGARNLTPKGFQGQPSFSPDGGSIVFERDLGAGDNGVHLMDSDGSDVRRLTRNPFPQQDSCGCDTDPNFSPDGNTITFVRVKKDEELAALFAMDVDGHVRRLTPYTYDVAIKHAWSPDGRRIAITINGNPKPGGSANLVTIRPDGTGLRRLTTFTDGRNAYVGSYSPDGAQIVMRLERGETFSLATISSSGGAIHSLTTGPTRPRFIDWGSHR